jgi:hypothetical protein
MKKYMTLGLIAFTMAGCSDATRTVPVIVVDERTISGDRPKLEIPPDYRNPTLPIPKEDNVLREYQKNNFLGEVKTVPLPPKRPK